MLVAVTGVTVAGLPVGFIVGVPNFVIVEPNMACTIAFFLIFNF
jgi:hypothetical protein